MTSFPAERSPAHPGAHEQGAGHAAEGYCALTGLPGVVLVTSGPGATNIGDAVCATR